MSAGELSELEVLDIRSNLIEGALPIAEIGRLRGLRYLGLHSNRLDVEEVRVIAAMMPACKVVW